MRALFSDGPLAGKEIELCEPVPLLRMNTLRRGAGAIVAELHCDGRGSGEISAYRLAEVEDVTLPELPGGFERHAVYAYAAELSTHVGSETVARAA